MNVPNMPALTVADRAAWKPEESTPVAAPALETQRVVECRWLLALYAVVPISLAIVAIDVLLLDHAWQRAYLPPEPERWAFWTVVFGLPHIVASLLTMADREYLAHYRHSLLVPALAFLAISAAGYLGPQPISQSLLFVIIAVYTVFHVFAQQLGLTLMMMSMGPTRTYKAWKWLAIAAGLAIYVVLYGQAYLPPNVDLGVVNLAGVLDSAAIALSVGVVALAIPLTRQARTRIGILYLWANVAMIVTACAINEIGYTLFVILIPRIIHDVTAFIVYITHDSNRNAAQPRNALYRLTGGRIPPLVLLPAVSIAIAYVLTLNEHRVLVSVAILTISFLHYYFEGFIWRGSHPHRQYLSFRR